MTLLFLLIEGRDDQVASRPSATDTGEKVDMTIPAIDDQSLNIADIERYETEQKIRDVPTIKILKIYAISIIARPKEAMALSTI